MLGVAAVASCLLLLLPVSGAQQCMQRVSPTLEDKVTGSEVVIQGYSTKRLERGGRQLEVKVDCVYKGGPLPVLLNITSGPTGQAACVLEQLTKERRSYLMYLKIENSNLFPVFNADPDAKRYLDELEMVCGLQVQHPTGVSSSNKCMPEKFQSEEGDDCSVPVKTLSSADNAATAIHRVCALHFILAILTAIIFSVQ